jgi:aminoglycoside phosphotransferase (APT) family kinase protein
MPKPPDAAIAAALARAGVRDAPLAILERDGRRGALLPGDRIAWFPRHADGAALLARERRVLRLLERHCRFAAPRVLHEDGAGWDLRTMVPGVSNPYDVHERAREDRALAVRIGAQLGRILADQHARVPASALGAWLPALPDWPRAEDLPRLPQVVEDRALLARIDEALRRRAALVAEPGPRVLTHSDLGFHNIAFDPATFDVAGVFDYQGAAFGDRHLDFNKMSLHCADGSEPLLEAAAGVYEELTGAAIHRGRVLLLNATEAIGFLGFRFGHAPEEEWCGRTLAQDLAWADKALRTAGIP